MIRDVVLILWWFSLHFRQYDISGGGFLDHEVRDGQAAHVDDRFVPGGHSSVKTYSYNPHRLKASLLSYYDK